MKEGEIGKIYNDGEVVFQEGDEGNTMYVIQSGNVEVLKKTHDGDLTIRILNPGDIFGEMSLFERMPRSATVRAKGEARILSVDKQGFFPKISSDPTLAFNILNSMSKRIRALTDELAKFKKQGEDIL